MNTLLTVVMVLAALVMLWGVARQKAGVVWARPLATAAALVAVAAALVQLLGAGDTPLEEIALVEEAYQRIGARKLAAYLAEEYPGVRVLIVKEPELAAPSGRVCPLVEGLRAGFADKVTVVGEIAPEVPAGAYEAFLEGGVAPGEPAGESGIAMLPPPEFWFTAAVFDKLVEAHRDDCDLIVSTIGLPMELRRMKYWHMRTAPRLALANGPIHELRSAIRQDRVTAALTYNPSICEWDTSRPPRDPDKAFAQRFLLVTPANVDSVAATHRDLFFN